MSQIGRNLSDFYVSDVETTQNWKSPIEIGNPAWVNAFAPPNSQLEVPTEVNFLISSLFVALGLSKKPQT